jgi:hypothetical protein
MIVDLGQIRQLLERYEQRVAAYEATDDDLVVIETLKWIATALNRCDFWHLDQLEGYLPTEDEDGSTDDETDEVEIECSHCLATILNNEQVCGDCAFPDDDGEVFHYKEILKDPPRGLRIVSIVSEGKSGALMLAGPLAEVQQAAKVYGNHVRLEAVDAAPAVTLEVAALNAAPPPACPEEDAADRTDWAAS